VGASMSLSEARRYAEERGLTLVTGGEVLEAVEEVRDHDL